jgi:Leucine-rich repeat (LRR) protein
LSDQDLTTVPIQELKTLPNLFSLKLNQNNINAQAIREFFDSEVGPRIEHLEINENAQIQLIGTSIEKMKALVHLEAKNSGVTELADEIKECSALKVLILDENALDMMPTELPKSLTKLSVARNNIMSLSSTLLEKFVALEDLNVSHNLLNALSAKIPRTFKHINIGNNNIQALPWKELSECKQLVTLIVNDNGIKSVPKLLGDIASLRTLNLARNPINSIPQGVLGGLKNLKVLHLEGLPIKSLPTDLPESLEELYLNDCTGLDHVPEIVSKLPLLRVLDMVTNEFCLFLMYNSQILV